MVRGHPDYCGSLWYPDYDIWFMVSGIRNADFWEPYEIDKIRGH